MRALPYSGIHNVDNISVVGPVGPSIRTLEHSCSERPYRVASRRWAVMDEFHRLNGGNRPKRDSRQIIVNGWFTFNADIQVQLVICAPPTRFLPHLSADECFSEGDGCRLAREAGMLGPTREPRFMKLYSGTV